MTAILEITDGTTTVSLLNGEFGYYTDEWEPAIAELKGGGTWQSSPMGNSRTLVTRQWGNSIERFLMKVVDASQDSTIRKTQELRRLLEKATAYTLTGWQNSAVYLKAQATCETNPRYSRIHNWSTPDDKNPLAQPFLQPDGRAVMDDWLLVIERDPFWTSNAPGTGTATAMGATEDYDGRTLGRAATTNTNEVYVANKRNVANLTDIYVNDGGAFGPNLMDAALPFDLFPAVPAVNDYCYFGCDTTVADSGPFCSVVFDIATAQNDLTVGWEYWNGAWVPLTTQDNTAQFVVTGVNSVHWEQESDWATTAVNGVTGYWVRAYVAAIGAAPSPPTQQNRLPYSITWPYVEIASTEVGGDLPAQMRALIYNESLSRGAPAFSGGSFDRLIVGLRSTSRGTGFTSFLNISDEQNPTGVTVSASAPDTTIGDNVQAATGRVATYAPGATRTLSTEARITLAGPLLADFFGKFKIYLRCELTTGGDNDVTTKLVIGPGASTSVPISYESRTRSIQDTGDVQLVDFGAADIPGAGAEPGDDFAFLSFVVYLGTTNAAATLDLHELVLIPIDEWAGDYSQVTSSGPGTNDITIAEYLDIDGVVSQKRRGRALRRNVSDNGVTLSYRAISNGSPMLQSNATQRLWFVTTAFGESIACAAQSIVVSRNQQYFSGRGDR